MSLSEKYKTEEIKVAFHKYFYGSGTDFFFPHPKLDEISEQECKEAIRVRGEEFLEVLRSPDRKGEI